MGNLSVDVLLHGTVVESQLLQGFRVARLGESVGADVAFPGADVLVRRTDAGLEVRGQTLLEGEALTMDLGRVVLRLEHTAPPPVSHRQSVPHELQGSFDGRFLIALLCIVVSSSWLDAFEFWASHRLPALDERPVLQGWAEHLSSLSAAEDIDSSKAIAVGRADSRAAETRSAAPQADGPPHEPDDHSSRVHWYRWYRSEVPRDREQLEAARAAHLQDPADAEARSVLGRAAYDADRYARAADQYEAILARHPHDPSARLRLARVEMRRGHHTKEIQHYRVLLSRNAFDVAARSGLAVALTRLERLDEAAEHLEELRLEHPAHPLTLLTEAKTLALAGRDAEVLEAIDDLMRARGTLSAEWRLEIRRDIALDPAFARLRKNVRLRGVMNRHLGAAGPRPMR